MVDSPKDAIDLTNTEGSIVERGMEVEASSRDDVERRAAIAGESGNSVL